MEYQDAYDYFRVARTYLMGISQEIFPVLLALNMGAPWGGWIGMTMPWRS